ncbi:MAG: hypothetical protein M3Y49_07005 [Actinomycetota bacterium]|nr:hypothetical protein [Actinomycetota bacterium]
MRDFAANRDEEAAIRRAREVLGPPPITPEAAQRYLRGVRRVSLWGLAVLQVFVLFGNFGLRGYGALVMTWIAVGAQIICLTLVLYAMMQLREWKNVAVRESHRAP